MLGHAKPASCTMDTCFDMLSESCSLTFGFPVYFYQAGNASLATVLDYRILREIKEIFENHRHGTDNSGNACAIVVALGAVAIEGHEEDTLDGQETGTRLENYLHSLPSWETEGSNHVLINLTPRLNFLAEIDTGQAIVASAAFLTSSYRSGFDITIPLPPPAIDGRDDAWSQLPPVDPAFRKFLFLFHGELVWPPQSVERRSAALDAVREALEILGSERHWKSAGVDVSVRLSCDGESVGQPGEWDLCGDARERGAALSRSTFSLLVAPLNGTLATSAAFQTRLAEALRYGAVPVILGSSIHRRLPYSELIQWEEAAVLLPLQRIKDLPSILISFRSGDISHKRLQGRFIWENYFSSTRKIVDTILAVVRTRLRIPAHPAKEEKSAVYFDSTGALKKKSASQRVASETFGRNMSTTLSTWPFNQPGDPFSLFPSTPYEPPLSTAAQAWGPQNFSLGPTGSNVSRPQVLFDPKLAGNSPQEQFTAIILTYKRMTSLVALLNRLKGLPFLNKVLIVWNDPTPPSPYTLWPDLGVPLQVLKCHTNSLNNRFLPFDAIETDAIFSLDDDIDVDHDKIVLAFKVWRTERDRVVGFFFRYHVWNNSTMKWEYSWDKYPGEVSIAITSATFYHKYYHYLYSQVMPRAIRDHVTKKMNCEDIAMNFLIAHVTRKPPIRVAWKWKFSVCGGPCPAQSISSKNGHLQERHECMDLFARIFGYMPLLFTSYSVDILPDYA